MPLAKCNECGAPVSDAALTCPQCGAMDPSGSIREKLQEPPDPWIQAYLGGIIGFIVAFLLVFLIAEC